MDEETMRKVRQAFADQLCAERAASRMTQMEVVEKSGIKIDSLRRYEAGKRAIPSDALLALADAIGFDASRFVDRAQERIKDL